MADRPVVRVRAAHGVVLLAAMLPGLAVTSDGAADETCALTDDGTGTVVEIIDGDTLSLADGRVVRLAGIEAPKPFPVQPGADVAAVVEASRKALEELAAGAAVDLKVGAGPEDRHGRILAEVRLGDGSSLQEALVADGFARVRPPDGNYACLGPLLMLEREARRRKFGLWGHAEFGVIGANDPSLLERKGLYVLVVGRVVSVGRGDRLDFLNFGRDWRRDFTAMVDVAASERLAESGRPISTLSGRRVIVRGVIEESGGPAMRLSDPSEIEILDDE